MRSWWPAWASAEVSCEPSLRWQAEPAHQRNQGEQPRTGCPAGHASRLSCTEMPLVLSLDELIDGARQRRMSSDKPPILAAKDYAAASVFEPANLLREARRQKGLPPADVPAVCVLDPDGDILRALRRDGRATLSPAWACYHTDLYEFDEAGLRLGIIGCAVGASFAVLLAEELFVSGCRLLISMTSAGQVVEEGSPPYFILIDRALRDEGTSYHYLPPAEFAEADRQLAAAAMQALRGSGQTVYRGA